MERIVIIDSNGKVKIVENAAEATEPSADDLKQTKSSFDLKRIWKNNIKSKGRPSDSPFYQQKLKSWQPILVPKTIIPVYFLLGLAMVALGAYFNIVASLTREVVLDYTNCDTYATENFTSNGVVGGVSEWKFDNSTNVCTIRFKIDSSMNGPLKMSYYITNMHQNHRRYLQSFSARQLLGDAVSAKNLINCLPIQFKNVSDNFIPYYPCGLIANTFFNDTYHNLTRTLDGFQPEFSEKGLVFEHEKKKFRATKYQPDEDGVYRSIIPPPNWSSYGGVYTVDNFPEIWNDEHFMVWMRTANYPNFRKPYALTNDSLSNGDWEIKVVTRYPVRLFKGTKGVVIGNYTWMGYKNNFFGIAYMTVGFFSLIAGAIFLFFYIKYPRKTGDINHLSWKRNKKE